MSATISYTEGVARQTCLTFTLRKRDLRVVVSQSLNSIATGRYGIGVAVGCSVLTRAVRSPSEMAAVTTVL